MAHNSVKPLGLSLEYAENEHLAASLAPQAGLGQADTGRRGKQDQLSRSSSGWQLGSGGDKKRQRMLKD